MASEACPAKAAGGLRLIAADARQALRTRRFLMAAGTSLLLPVVLAASAWFGVVEFQVAGLAAALICLLIAVYYAIIRSGLNLRFGDPSLTGEMILTAILCIACVGYYAGE